MRKRSSSERHGTVFLYVALTFGVLVLGYSLFTLLSDRPLAKEQAIVSSLKMTPFDRTMALKLMDTNGDGKCDACGMPVEMCIDSGELECTMGGGEGIGKLDSIHIHADFKVYVNGNVIAFSDKAHMERMRTNLPVSSFIHVDSGNPSPEKTGDVLHMHATDVPLWIFFESIGMKLEKECLTLDTENTYCNNEENSLKFYVNGRATSEYGEYVFSDNDRILISYGPLDEDITSQMESVTTYAQNHEKK